MNDDTLHRRHFLQCCAASAFGVTLPSLLQDHAFAAPQPSAKGAGFGKARRVIFLMIGGGLTHIDTFDPKKGDTKGPGSTVRTSADGEFTSFIPETAKVADKLCVIRSMTAKIGTHREASYFMRTAFKEISTIVHPMLGAWAQQLLGRSHPVLPSTVCVGRDAGYGNGFLPSSMSPLPILDPEAGLQHRSPKGGLATLQARLGTLNELDRAFREQYPDRNIQAYTDFYDDSIRMMGGKDGDAFDLTQETDAIRDAYGRTKFGQGCLLARRLTESGVRFVEVQFGGWDFHKNLDSGLEDLAPVLDQAYAQLIRDLDQRGLLDETLVVLASEFGRTPKISNGGRNHHPGAFTSVLAGAGVKAGHIHGATDAEGGKVADKPVTVGDLHATIGWSMGISSEMPIVSPNGRPFTIGDKATPVMELFA